ncbi:MAG: type III pantothenate kinase [Methylovulum sp.]|nr:type III pantothenate kinase [Methylovulum sp.]
MNLLIDMGNTRIKWAVDSNGQLIAGQPLLNRQLDRQKLVDLWVTVTKPQSIGISCVSANPLLALVQSVVLELWMGSEVVFAKSEAHAFGVVNAYQHAEKLGVDRWLALIAVRRQHYAIPACIVDCGTAITVDLLAADGTHQGGFISPGLTLMKQALAQGTDALPFNETYYVVGPAKVTEAAIYAGTLSSAAGLIEHVLKMQTETVQLILTGGDAGLVAQQLTIPLVIDADLVLQGLAIVLGDRQ